MNAQTITEADVLHWLLQQVPEGGHITVSAFNSRPELFVTVQYNGVGGTGATVAEAKAAREDHVASRLRQADQLRAEAARLERSVA